jgi:hypothetical protein
LILNEFFIIAVISTQISPQTDHQDSRLLPPGKGISGAPTWYEWVGNTTAMALSTSGTRRQAPCWRSAAPPPPDAPWNGYDDSLWLPRLARSVRVDNESPSLEQRRIDRQRSDHDFDVIDGGVQGKASTIGRRCAAIRYVHSIGDHPNPTDDERVKAVVRGIRRTLGVTPRRMTPATAERVMAMAPPADGSLTALRDRALLLLGFAGAFRRSELVALDIADIEEVPEGLRVTIRRGKTDQEGRGSVIAIVRGEVACPVAALKAWLSASESEGDCLPFDPPRRPRPA